MDERRMWYLQLLFLVVAQLLLFNPSLRWYFARITDGSDEPLGIVALVAMFFLSVLCHKKGSSPSSAKVTSDALRPHLWVPSILLCVFMLIGPVLPPLGRAAFASLSVATLLSAALFGTTLHPGLCSLALLSLPLISTLQFYAGFPLRYATGQVVSAVFRLGGFPVYAEGTLLRYRDSTVWIDAPCSGIKALWCSLFLVAVLITLKPLARRHRSLLWSATSIGVFFGNCIRNGILFMLELSDLPDEIKVAIHPFVGLCLIGGIACTSFLVWRALPKVSTHEPAGGFCLTSRADKASVSAMMREQRYFGKKPLLIMLSFVSVGLCILPRQEFLHFYKPKIIIKNTGDDTNIIERLSAGKGLVEVPLSSRELQWALDFRGLIRRFIRPPSANRELGIQEQNFSELLIRTVTVPTRKLHPIGDCLRGAGYEITPLPARRETDGVLKGCVRAIKRSKSSSDLAVRVCEHIVDQAGESVPDVSTWYWAATFGRTIGPWVSVVEVIEEDT
jgi:exosortase/archaeosortase family protein